MSEPALSEKLHPIKSPAFAPKNMEAAAPIVAKVAHHLNNLLTTIRGPAELLMNKLPPTNPAHKWAKMIFDSASHATRFVTELLVLSGRETAHPEEIEINKWWTSEEGRLRERLTPKIRLDYKPIPSPANIRVDPKHLLCVLENLIDNAVDACGDSGKITIESRFGGAGTLLVILVSDTGCGLAPEVKDRLFQPFFTTKDKGKARGLGLAVCHALVREAGGAIEAEGEMGKGSTFRILLPL